MVRRELQLLLLPVLRLLVLFIGLPMLLALGDGRPPLAAAQSAGNKLNKKRASPDARPMAYLRAADARALWCTGVAPALNPPASDAVFEDTIELMRNEGLLVHSAGLVHLDTTLIA